MLNRQPESVLGSAALDKKQADGDSLLAGPENLVRPPKSRKSPACAIWTVRTVSWSTGSGTVLGVQEGDVDGWG